MKTITKHKVNATAPRLSDEDPDPIEQDESEGVSSTLIEGWLPWEPEDIADIRKLIAERLPPKQQFIIEAFLDGLTYNDVCVTEKYWRYHFAKGIELIRKELKL
jgi:DNA-directed RNA polymerase specialized sigma24 family protein